MPPLPPEALDPCGTQTYMQAQHPHTENKNGGGRAACAQSTGWVWRSSFRGLLPTIYRVLNLITSTEKGKKTKPSFSTVSCFHKKHHYQEQWPVTAYSLKFSSHKRPTLGLESSMPSTYMVAHYNSIPAAPMLSSGFLGHCMHMVLRHAGTTLVCTKQSFV